MGRTAGQNRPRGIDERYLVRGMKLPKPGCTKILLFSTATTPFLIVATGQPFMVCPSYSEKSPKEYMFVARTASILSRVHNHHVGVGAHGDGALLRIHAEDLSRVAAGDLGDSLQGNAVLVHAFVEQDGEVGLQYG